MIRFDETPQPSNTGMLLQALLQGTAQFQRLRHQRKQDADEQRNMRLRNMFAGAGGEVGEEDAQFVNEMGLGSRLSPLAGAVAGGQRRYKINPTPQQQLELASAEKNLAALKRQEEDERKSAAVRQFLTANQVEDPETQAQAYWRAGVDDKLPATVKELLLAKIREEAQARMFAQQYGLEGTRQANRLALKQPTTPIKQ